MAEPYALVPTAHMLPMLMLMPPWCPGTGARRRPSGGGGLSPRLTSPKLRGGNLQESISGSKLYRDLSPTRVYGSNQKTDEVRTSLPELFKQRNGLQALRPVALGDTSPRDDVEMAKAPKLLQRWAGGLGTAGALSNQRGGHTGTRGEAWMLLPLCWLCCTQHTTRLHVCSQQKRPVQLLLAAPEPAPAH